MCNFGTKRRGVERNWALKPLAQVRIHIFCNFTILHITNKYNIGKLDFLNLLKGDIEGIRMMHVSLVKLTEEETLVETRFYVSNVH